MNCSCIKVYWQRGKQDYFEDTFSIFPQKIFRPSVFSVLFLLSETVQIIISLTKGRSHDKYILSLYGGSAYRLSLLLFCHSEKDLWLCSGIKVFRSQQICFIYSTLFFESNLIGSNIDSSGNFTALWVDMFLGIKDNLKILKKNQTPVNKSIQLIK